MPSLETVILDILEAKQPRNVKELVQLVQEQADATLDDIEKEVRNQHAIQKTSAASCLRETAAGSGSS